MDSEIFYGVDLCDYFKNSSLNENKAFLMIISFKANRLLDSKL